MKKLKIFIALLCFVSLATFAQEIPKQNDFEISKNLDVFVSVYKQLNDTYVDNVNPGKLIKTAIDAMLESLDPYTVYIPESQIEDYRFMTTGQYGGVGAMIYRRGSYVYISEPYKNAPADKAGLKAGDKIVEIDGKSAKNKSIDDVSTALKGQAGTNVKLLIERDSTQKPFEKELTREEIKVDNVPYYGMVSDNVGYINLSEFKQNAAKEVRDAFEKLNANKSLKGIILDLRGNGGGLLNEAVNIVNIFVDKGQLVCSTKGKIKDKNNVHKTQMPAIDTKIPLIVLVDDNSASASEIVTGAIQDLDRGVVIGQRTFGKGLVQNIVPLTYNSQMKITIAKYYIPSGRCVQAIDYFHKDSEGKSLKVPDSLLKPFKTSKGRTVFEGRGIDPDIIMELPEFKNITETLISKNLVFDFAVTYNRKHPSIDSVATFEVTNDIYDEFCAFLKDKDYSYVTESESALNAFKKDAETEKYFDAVKAQYDALHEKILSQKNNDLVDNKKEIMQVVKLFLVPLYYYQHGRIEASLKDDLEVKKAIEVINNTATYNSILDGSLIIKEGTK